MAQSLGKFEGKPVTGLHIIINNTGAGLTKAMDIEPVLHHVGDKAYAILELDASKIRFDPIKSKDDPDVILELIRIQIYSATAATLADPDLCKPIVDEMKRRISERELEQENAAREAAGEQRME